MAGMDWFRWHHGSVTDPKFQLVARKSGASLPDVLAVWAYILEAASQSAERGDFGAVDCEALDCLFGFPATETRTADILKAMQARDLVDGSRVAAWEKRQPKRERDDPTNSDRQATFRAKKNQVTPDNATDDQKTPREEKSREEKKEHKEPSGSLLPASRKTKLPSGFYPNETGIQKAEDSSVNVAIELAKFTDYHRAKGSTMADWQAAWRTWVGNAATFSRAGPANRQASIEARNKAAGEEWLRQEGVV